ncbi:MAG TPA: bifunctional UDP-N-acetylglucosamine diphosphorylase/glucosamine-1-phosphate N-acetyltransferase GlmU [Xanthobacteraceae bacterium]|nr:bifunctional UDP-N-acetylglucosamine diphosphorylase/glucosamine-1-phosphate N-acetyltransferase GlmU [Xanthobacteraceae bacterium]
MIDSTKGRAEPTAIVLAAGEGTRMASRIPKVLHRVAGRSLLAHTIASVTDAGAGRIAVVVGPDREDVGAEARRYAPRTEVFVQTERRGTAHAVLAARQAIEGSSSLLIVFGDTPLLRADTLKALADGLKEAAVAVLGFRAADPTGYGRLLVRNGELVAIREERDASDEERKVDLCNAGAMAIDGRNALALLDRITDSNAKREFYLTDIVALARADKLKVVVREAAEEEVMGVNDKSQLAAAEAGMQARLREAAMRGGAILVAPETVHLSDDTKLGRDVIVEPYVVFGPGVTVEEGAVIHSFSHLEGASIGAGTHVGPFARLRAGTKLGKDVRVGNFVETKAAEFGDNAKANHLAYVGDSTVGNGANIGAGTITCNYDGFGKHRTEIGSGAFIGSNSALVAPVKIGAGAYVASGSVITSNIPDDALGVGRSRQVNKDGWARDLRALKGGQKGGD